MSVSPALKYDVVQVTKEPDKIGSIVSRYLDMETQAKADTKVLLALQAEIFGVMGQSKLTPAEYKIIFKRHFKYESWNQIRHGMNYSERAVFSLYKSALDKIDLILCSKMQ